MGLDDFALPRWNDMPPGERERVARRLGADLPTRFRFAGLRWHELGDQRHQVAFFECDGAEFALVPGGPVTLGYDPARPFRPTEAQRASWDETAEEYDLGTLEAFLPRMMTPPRTAELAPFLMEVRATEAGREPLAPEAPEVGELAAGAGPGMAVERYSGRGGHVRVVTQPAGPARGYRVVWQTQREVSHRLAGQGFRLPTSDEWEHACRAGSRSLFRWGDDCPMDRYPAGDRLAETSAWDLHRRPNAFGLRVATDPYDWELVAEPVVLRGGDGGGFICGGAGFFAGWLPLASAYVAGVGEAYREKPVPGAHVRRVYPLA